MSWSQFEVWSSDEDGIETLVLTTSSKKEALAAMHDEVNGEFGTASEAWIVLEDSGDFSEVMRLTRG